MAISNNGPGQAILLVASLPESLLTFRRDLILALKGEGFVVHVAAPDLPVGSELHRALSSLGVTVHEIPLARTGTNPVADIRLFVSLVQLMRRLKLGYVLGYTVKPVVYGLLAARVAGVPRRFALITGLGYAFAGDGSTGRRALENVVQSLYRQALRDVDGVFFQNPDDQGTFRERGLLDSKTPSYVLAGSGVNVDEFAVSPVPSAPSFLLIARLLGEKGVREYAEAARRIRARHPGVRFRLAGWIDQNPDAISQRELESWIAEGSVEFMGRLSDVRQALAECSVFVLPSYREGTPRTVLEAMAVGRAIITTDAPGCRETVRPGENGILVPVRRVQELCDAMQRFITDPALAGHMGERSRRIAEDRYDVRKVNSAMLEVLCGPRMGVRENASPWEGDAMSSL